MKENRRTQLIQERHEMDRWRYGSIQGAWAG